MRAEVVYHKYTVVCVSRLAEVRMRCFEEERWKRSICWAKEKEKSNFLVHQRKSYFSPVSEIPRCDPGFQTYFHINNTKEISCAKINKCIPLTGRHSVSSSFLINLSSFNNLINLYITSNSVVHKIISKPH
ncbi:hypothetical protein NPIL_619741 [Nephila pilipes]|uniref:Uncharacterized protein n=1 Tax=Nephila pilipes TaxID=299642 RepID=A0A8X6QWV1_NEPPI|nr:hypothetical protein NPIL_619741 [Nephila pilipes]